MVLLLVLLMVSGVSGEPTHRGIQFVNRLVTRAPLPISLRRLVADVARVEHNLVFMGPQLESNDVTDVADALGLPLYLNGAPLSPDTPLTQASKVKCPRLNIIDSGAGVDSGDGVQYAVPGTRRSNSLAVSTANGVVVPPEQCTTRIPCKHRRGRVGYIERPSSLIMSSCAPNLISVDRLAAESGYGFWLIKKALCVQPLTLAMTYC